MQLNNTQRLLSRTRFISFHFFFFIFFFNFFFSEFAPCNFRLLVADSSVIDSILLLAMNMERSESMRIPGFTANLIGDDNDAFDESEAEVGAVFVPLSLHGFGVHRSTRRHAAFFFPRAFPQRLRVCVARTRLRPRRVAFTHASRAWRCRSRTTTSRNKKKKN